MAMFPEEGGIGDPGILKYRLKRLQMLEYRD